jgi:hypothetical protein
MIRRRHLAEETGRSDIIGGRKAVSAEETVLFFEPGVEGGVPFKLPKRGRGADTEEEAEDGCVAGLLGHRERLDAGNVLADSVSGGDITFHGEDAIRGGVINRKEDVVGVSGLQDREKVRQKRLDGKCRSISGRTVNIDTEESRENRGGIGTGGEEVDGGSERGVHERGGGASSAVGDAIVVDVHGNDRRVDVRRNQYVESVESNPASRVILSPNCKKKQQTKLNTLLNTFMAWMKTVNHFSI